MRAVMVKHTTESKGYWFEAPNNLADKIHPGVRVVCDTAIGQQDGTVSSVLLSNGEDDAKEIMIAAGAKFPLRRMPYSDRRHQSPNVHEPQCPQ